MPPDGETRFDLGGKKYRRGYDHCLLCGHYFSRHHMQLSDLYNGDYLDSTYGGEAGMRERLEQILDLPPEQSDNAGRVTRILAFADDHFDDGCSSRSLLDIGAGIGVFPAAMKSAGWSVTAIEPDPRTVNHLRNNVGVTACAGSLMDIDSGRLGPFHVVTFNKVLEHIEDPVPVLIRGRDFVTRDGFVYVELPDVAAAAEGPEREEFFVEHHHVFSPASVAMLANRAGLSPAVVERLREPSGKFTLRAFLLP